ncbi:MAG: germination protein YpeB [Oscillospiraceae bacterium]|jgi:germination protein YpeB|nr:germination protein YpeB [Oscillospiraceae bacterium]
MNFSVSRRTAIRIITYLSASVAVLAAFAVNNYVVARNYKYAVEYTYQRAWLSLSENIDTIDITLQKTMYAGSDKQFSDLAAKLCAASEMAKSDLGQIPTHAGELTNANKFISQVGNYATSLANKRSLDEDITTEEKETLQKLRDYAGKLRLSIDDLFQKYMDAGTWLGQAQEAVEKEEKDDEENKDPVSRISSIEDDVADFPTLIYDGPFSDHIFQRHAQSVENKKKVSQKDAQKIASDFMAKEGGALRYSQTIGGNLPTYIFASKAVEVGVTVQGGAVTHMQISRNVTDSAVKPEEAIELAERFLSQRKMSDMKHNYYEIQGGVCVINFAGDKNGVTIYPDLIKVGVALDNGEIVSYDAVDYVMNHVERQLPSVLKSEEEAKAIVSRELTVEKASLALIPTEGLSEKLCWEFKCKSKDNKTVLVYVNAQNLVEENILIITSENGGKLTV